MRMPDTATPLLVRQKTCIRLDSLTAPAGLLTPSCPRSESSIELAPGDWLLISLVTASQKPPTKPAEEFGDDGLFNAFGRMADGTAAEVCEGIVNEVRNYVREQRQADDITLIAVKVF